MKGRFAKACLLALATLCASCAPRAYLAKDWKEAMEKMPEKRVLVVAHRGARSLAPENTLAAGRKAFEVGADAWEIDVHMTRDGRLVVIHDDTLARTTNVEQLFPDRKPWYVCDFTLDEIRRLDAGSWFVHDDPFGQIKAGAVSPEECRSYVGERVPTLREALRLTRECGGWIDIEIKQPRRYPGIVEKVVETVRAERMEDRVVISCFDHTVVREVKALDPKVAAGPIVSNRLAEAGRYVRRLLRGDGYFASGDVVGMGSIAFSGSKGAPGSLDPRDLNRDDIASLKRSGVALFVWTINDERQMRALIDAGVTGIVTDFPQRLARLLQSR